jgi:hypothetical protein
MVAAAFAFVYRFWRDADAATQRPKVLVCRFTFLFFDPATPMHPVQAVCASLLRWSPLFINLFLDALKRQSKLFRLTLPGAYFAYVVATYGLFGCVLEPELILANSSRFAGMGSRSFQGQISGSLASLGLLMATFLTNAMNDSSGQAVLFPVKCWHAVRRVLANGRTVGLVGLDRETGGG